MSVDKDNDNSLIIKEIMQKIKEKDIHVEPFIIESTINFNFIPWSFEKFFSPEFRETDIYKIRISECYENLKKGITNFSPIEVPKSHDGNEVYRYDDEEIQSIINRYSLNINTNSEYTIDTIISMLLEYFHSLPKENIEEEWKNLNHNHFFMRNKKDSQNEDEINESKVYLKIIEMLNKHFHLELKSFEGLKVNDKENTTNFNQYLSSMLLKLADTNPAATIIDKINQIDVLIKEGQNDLNGIFDDNELTFIMRQLFVDGLDRTQKIYNSLNKKLSIILEMNEIFPKTLNGPLQSSKYFLRQMNEIFESDLLSLEEINEYYKKIGKEDLMKRVQYFLESKNTKTFKK